MTASPRAADLAEGAVQPAARLVAVVHGDGDVDDVADIFMDRSYQEMQALAVVLAAMVDPDKTLGELLAWTKWQPPTPVAPQRAGAALPSPHGTHAAFNRHKANGQEPCFDCAEGEREYQRARGARRRAAARQQQDAAA